MAKGKKGARTAAALPRAAAAPAADQPIWPQLKSEGLAWGIALVIFFRPWRDGLTFRTDNFYYLWILSFLFALYLARVLLRGRVIRFGRIIALAAAFLVVALATAPATIQYDSTYRTILLWCGHIMLFMMVADGLRTRLAFNIVLTAFLVTSFIEAFWSILHYYYALPELRRLINEDPRMLVQHFGMEDVTPILRHRLETNRAFGRFLFANALAAFLIIGIPYVASAILPTLHDVRAAWAAAQARPADEYRRLRQSGLLGLAMWFLSFVVAGLLYPFFLYHLAGDSDWLAHPVKSTFFLGVVPIAVAAGPYVIARTRGVGVAGLALRAAFLPALLLAQLASLYLSFSRGGVIAVLMAIGAGAVFLAFAWRGKLTRFAKPAFAAIAFGLIMVSAYGASSWAQGDAHAPAAAPATVESSGPALDIEGRDLTTADIVNPASFFLRVTYWKVALAVARDYWLTGVGLGNFSTVYPVYQYLGAGDVQAAHNDYLQYLCETGVFGLLAFVAFWAYLIIDGARRVLTIESRREQVYLVAMLAGVLAFLLHALVDFPFVNPSLAFFQYLMAGMFLVRIGLHLPEHTNRNAYRVVAGVLLVLAAFVVGASMRVFVSDYVLGGRALLHVGNPRVLGQRAQAATFLLKAQREAERRARAASSDPLLMPIGPIFSLIPSLDNIQTFSEILVPATPGGESYRAPASGETISADALVRITDPAEATKQGAAVAQLWIQELERLDQLYPHNSELALYLAGMYNELVQAAPDKQERLRYILRGLDWARTAIERNPLQSVCWQYYGIVLTHRANAESSSKAIDYYNQMLEAFKKATELYPIGADHWFEYSAKTRQLARVLANSDPARAEALMQESREARARGEVIQKFRHEHGI